MNAEITADDVNDVFRSDVYGDDDIFTRASFADFVRCNDVDLRLSLKVSDDNGLVGLMLIARRGERGWFGAYGVAPELREAGEGRRIFALALERARDAGITSIEFEVLHRNDVAVKLYRSFGFETIDELLVLSRNGRAGARRRHVFAARSSEEISAIARTPAACWQREPRSVAAVPATALLPCEGAYALLRQRSDRITLADAGARDEAAARELATLLDTGVPEELMLLNEPADSPLAHAFRRARWRVIERQHRMKLTL